MGGHGGGGHGGGGHGRGGWGGGYVIPTAYGYGLYDDDTLDPLDDTGSVLVRRRLYGVIAGDPPPPHTGGHPLGRHAHPHHKQVARIHNDLALVHGGVKPRWGWRQPHGEDMEAVGDAGMCEPNEEVDSFPGVDEQPHSFSGVDNELALSGGGVDAFALASFGEDVTPSQAADLAAAQAIPTGDKGSLTEDVPEDLSLPEAFDPMSMTDVGDRDFTPLLHSGRTGTLRHPHVDFGEDFGLEPDFYSGFGRAPVMGCDGATGKMGH